MKSVQFVYVSLGIYLVFTVCIWFFKSTNDLANYNLTLPNEVFIKIKFSKLTKQGHHALNDFPRRQATKPKITNSRCPNLDYPSHAVKDFWQQINRTRIYIYSAFFETSLRKIWIIGTRDTVTTKKSPFCQVWGQSDQLTVVQSETIDLTESRGRRYLCTIYSCDIRNVSIPSVVSLSTGDCVDSSNAILVQSQTNITSDFTVCVTPFNFNYSKAFELVEMIELNMILGASHFVFYNYSINTNVNSVLEHYIRLGFVEVLPWNLPMQVDTWPKKNPNIEIHYFGQIAALNDCLYRNMYKTNYIVYQDLDEFIIPRKTFSWKELINSLPQTVGAYQFRNTFFRKEWPDVKLNFTGKDTAVKLKAMTVLKQEREDKIFSINSRSKYIVNPRRIQSVGIHTVFSFRSGGRFFVPPLIALLHHYRNWENPKDDIPRVDEPLIMKYKDRLLANMNNTWGKLLDIPMQ